MCVRPTYWTAGKTAQFYNNTNYTMFLKDYKMKRLFLIITMCLFFTSVQAELTEAEVGEKATDLAYLFSNTVKTGNKCKRLMEYIGKPSTEISICKVYKKGNEKLNDFFSEHPDKNIQAEIDQVFKVFYKAVGRAQMTSLVMTIKTKEQEIQQLDKLYK